MDYSKLNNEQQKAVFHPTGPVAVIAGPGSGKTTVIVHRVAQLLERGVPPHNIVVFTYTKAAATEMGSRFLRLMGDIPEARRVTFGTFHSVLFRMLRVVKGYSLENLIDEGKKYIIFLRIIKDLGMEYEDEEEFMKEILSEYSTFKNNLIPLQYYHPTVCSDGDFSNIVKRYNVLKEEQDLFDFDDMVVDAYETFKNNEKVLEQYRGRYTHILIDEFQDINSVQYEVIKLLAMPRNEIFIVGDDDQSIYSFRGANPAFLHNFVQEFQKCERIVLNQNYRSNEEILKCSNQLIQYNVQRFPKVMVANVKNGVRPILQQCDDFEEEAKWVAETILKRQKEGIPLSEIAVIYRTNIQARAIVDYLLDHRIPMIVKDETKTIYDHWVVKDLEAYFQLSMMPDQGEAFERIINKPNRYIAKDVVKNGIKTYPSHPLSGLIQKAQLHEWQIDKLIGLQFELQKLEKLSPTEAIQFIRKNIGYEGYIEKYCDFKKMSSKGFFEILDEVQEGAKHYRTIQDYLEHLEVVRQEMKNQRRNTSIEDEAVILSTMHGAKGLEFDTVLLVGCNEGIIPHEKSNREQDMEEERRLFYVGMTRAKNLLYVSSPVKRFGKDIPSSPFVIEALDKRKTFDVEFKVGQVIEHIKYGSGEITELEKNIGTVKFGPFNTKKFDLKTCYEKEIIIIKG